jgi:hypothetical protein
MVVKILLAGLVERTEKSPKKHRTSFVLEYKLI